MAELFDTEIDLQGHKIQNVAAGTDPTDVARLQDIDDRVDEGVTILEVSADDAVAEYLEDKLQEGAHIGITKVDGPGGAKRLQIAITGNLGFGEPGDTVIATIPAGAREDNDTDVPKLVGAFALNPSQYALNGTAVSAKFRAVAAAGNGSVVGRVKLRNVTDSVDVATLTFTGSSATQKQEVALAIPGDLPNSEKVYEVTIYVDAHVSGSDLILLYSAALQVINTGT